MWPKLPVAAGKLFHTCGPATAKLLSPRVVEFYPTTSAYPAHADFERGNSPLFLSVPSLIPFILPSSLEAPVPLPPSR